MAGLEKNLAVQRFGPPPKMNASAYAETLRNNAVTATDFLLTLQKAVNKALQTGVPTAEGINIEHLGVMFFLNDLYLHDYIEVLSKLGEHQFVHEINAGVAKWVDKSVQISIHNIPIELHKGLGLPPSPPETIELTMSTLARANRLKLLKLQQPEHFSFLVEFFIAEYQINPSHTSNFVNTLMTSLVMDLKDITLIRTKLNRQNAYKSPEVISALISNVELLQKFADIFLVALVNIDHPNHVMAQKLLVTLLSSYNPNSTLLENDLPTFVCGALGQALMTRARTTEGQKKLGCLPGDWLIRFEELDETSPNPKLSFEHLSKAIAREVENDASRNQNFVVTSKTFLENIPLYADLLQMYIRRHQLRQLRDDKQAVTVAELEQTGQFIERLLAQIIAPFPLVKPLELGRTQLQTKFPFIDFGNTKPTLLAQEALQLSPELRAVFPTVKSIEVSCQSQNPETTTLHFIIKSNRVVGHKEQVDDYFSFAMAISGEDGTILPDLLELKQYDPESLKTDPAAQTINQLMIHLGLQALENLNRKQTPREKSSQQQMTATIISSLTGEKRPGQPQNFKKTRAVLAETNASEASATEQNRKPAKIQLMADNLAEFDLTRFGVPPAEAEKKILQAVALWNKEGNLTQSRLRSQPNLYRLACTVGATPVRVFFEIRPDPTAATKKRLTITSIRKRNEKTYKGLS